MADSKAKKKSNIKYQTLFDRAKGRYCKIASNTQKGWFEAEIPSVPIAAEDPEQKVVYLFEVELAANPEEEAGDVLSLQYFFVRTERELRTKRLQGENALFILLVHVQDEGDFFRVSSYLYLQSLMRKHMRFYIRQRGGNLVYEVEQEMRGIGRLPPLLCIAKKERDGDGDEGEAFLSYYQIAEEEKLKPELISRCVEEAKEPGTKKKEKDNTDRQKSSLERLRESNLFTPFQLICANYLTETLGGVKGTQEHPLQREEKEKLIDEINEYILSKRLETAAPLATLVWFIYLYYMQENKELYVWNESKDIKGAYVLCKDKLDKSYLDSREYVDGVLQLIENSCQHTQNGIAYVSIRVHYVDRNCPESELPKVAASRSRLIKRYSRDLSEKGEPDFSLFPRRLLLSEGVPHYFELRVTDDATYREGELVSARGIPTMHALNRKIKEPVRLYHVFGRMLASGLDDASKENLENVTYHYGVRQLQKIVLRNGGSFLVATPGQKSGQTEIYSAYYEKQLPDTVEEKKEEPLSKRVSRIRDVGWQQLTLMAGPAYPSTAYQILLPIGGPRMDRRKESGKISKSQALDLRALKDGKPYSASPAHDLYKEFREIYEANLHFTFTDKSSESSKKKATEALERRLREVLEKDGPDYARTIHVLDFSKIHGAELEFAAKALFLHIGHMRLESENGAVQQLYAACFADLRQMQEFILDYSVFYNENGQNPYMESVQIAVCSYRTNCAPEVCFLLAGSSIDAAWKTADIFAYYNNSENTLALLPQLKYLGDDLSWKREIPGADPVAAFPFDLYLKEEPASQSIGQDSQSAKDSDGAVKGEERGNNESKDVRPAPANDCWFMRQMADMIGRDLREQPLGCKIDHVHVRLGSKMHIEDFYEAELLFQNISMVVRFAYLIVQGILDERPALDEPLLVVGYETYSTILLEYVIQFLNECGIEAYYAVYGHDAGENPSFICSAALREARGMEKNEKRLITVYPIGTTLSTVYHMIDCVPRKYQARPWLNFCVLMVENENGEQPPRVHYWRQTPEQKGFTAASPTEYSMVTLESDQPKRAETKVRFYLRARTVWHEPDQCMESSPSNEAVLTYVDTTSTVPNMIFPLVGRKNDGPERLLHQMGKDAEESNNKRMERLNGCVYYGHIHVGNNHFLHYIDLPLYFERVRREMESELSAWAMSVDTEAFNIIVAPLERDNAAFVQTIADKVFAHSIRILRIPVLDARKEDVRAKYSFIGEEYRRVKAANRDTKINIYYATMSIVTGETFYRASKLIGMLLEDCAEAPRGFLFKGIFTLVNRSSYSTIRTMVKEPEKDFHAYLHLSVPQYNTYEGICPGCLHERKNQKILESCATRAALIGFSRLKEKQKLRSPEDHRKWLAEELRRSPEDFSTLCQWLYRQGKETRKEQEWTEELRTICLKLAQEGKSPVRLCEHRKQLDRFEHELTDLWINEIMQERSYLRLVCTHKAYCTLETEELFECPPKELSEKTPRLILDGLLLEKKTFDYSSTEYIEWVISYIKVLSRDYLSKHHYIRQAIFTIMKGFLGVMLKQPMRNFNELAPDTMRKLDRVAERCEGATPLQRYQLLMVILRQLASMQANVVIRGDTLTELMRAYQALADEQERLERSDPLARLCRLPAPEKAERDYIRCVKLCLLSGDEENKSLLLQNKKTGQAIWEEAL